MRTPHLSTFIFFWSFLGSACSPLFGRVHARGHRLCNSASEWFKDIRLCGKMAKQGKKGKKELSTRMLQSREPNLQIPAS